MAWETRGNPDRRYYYTATWSNGRVTKVYYGRGVIADIAAEADEEVRRRRAAEVLTLRAERSRLDPLDRLMQTLDSACHHLVEAAMNARGFHRVNYSAWRRRHVRADYGRR